jgi:hypothetical protein
MSIKIAASKQLPNPFLTNSINSDLPGVLQRKKNEADAQKSLNLELQRFFYDFSHK